jgi:hypothetical protein
MKNQFLFTIMTKMILFITIFLMIQSCNKDGNDKINNELSQDIQNLVSPDILAAIEDLGIIINRGTNPPIIENSYFCSPFVLKITSDPNDSFNPGYRFADYKVRFHNQDNQKLKLSLDYKNGPENGSGIGSFISGENNKFSIFSSLTSQHTNGSEASFILVISGTLDNGGVKDFYLANFMLNDYGDPTDVWMEEGQGRIIYDSDGFSEETTF